MAKKDGSEIEIGELGPLKILLKGAGFAFLGLALTKFSQYIFRLLIAREGAELYGVFSLGFTVFSIAGMLSFLGVTAGLYRFVPNAKAKGKRDEIASYLKSSLHIVSASSLLLMLILFFLSDWIASALFHDARISIVIKVLSLGLPFYAYTGLFLSVINSFFKNKYDVISKTVGESFLRVILAASAIMLGYGLFGISIAYVISIFASFVLALYFMEYKVFRFFRARYEFTPKYSQLLGYSMPLMLSGIIFLFINWTDSVLLGIFRTVAEVGIYNTALPTAGLLLMLPNALTTLFAPLVSDLLARGRKIDLGRTYQTANKWIFLLNFPLLLVFLVFPTQVLNVLFGREYGIAANSLVILSISNLFYSLTLSATFVLSSAGKSKALLANSIIAAVANILLNLFLVPAFGITGAAIGTGISLFAYGSACAYQVKKLIGFWPIAMNTTSILIAGIIALAVPLVASSYLDIGGSFVNLAIVGLATALVYAKLLSTFRAFDSLDLGIVDALEKKLGISLKLAKEFMKVK
ncbi:MAG: flippase [Candidatus Micrarchaeota archaeon]